MKIGIIYDLKDDYNLESVDFCDFTALEEVMMLANILSETGHKIKLLQGFDVVLKNVEYIKSSFDLVINLSEGHDSRNREALIPAILETYDIPYIGSDCYANIVSLDKYLTKLIARDLGILTPDFTLYLWKKHLVLKNFTDKSKIIIKPVCEGSSDGIEMFDLNSSNLFTKLDNIGNHYKQNILLEDYVEGSDYSVAVIGNPFKGYMVIGAVKIVDKQLCNLPIYDRKFKAHFNVIKTTPDWSENLKQEAYTACIKLAEVIELSGFFRFDFRICDDKCYFLEVNSIPSLLKDGSFIKAIEVNGLDKNKIFERILNNESSKS